MANVFDKFGGVRPMAEHLSQSPSTVQSWKTAGRIPATHQPAVLERAQELKLDVSAEDIIFPLIDRPHGVPSTDPVDAPSAGIVDQLSPEVTHA